MGHLQVASSEAAGERQFSSLRTSRARRACVVGCLWVGSRSVAGRSQVSQVARRSARSLAGVHCAAITFHCWPSIPSPLNFLVPNPVSSIHMRSPFPSPIPFPFNVSSPIPIPIPIVIPPFPCVLCKVQPAASITLLQSAYPALPSLFSPSLCPTSNFPPSLHSSLFPPPSSLLPRPSSLLTPPQQQLPSYQHIIDLLSHYGAVLCHATHPPYPSCPCPLLFLPYTSPHNSSSFDTRGNGATACSSFTYFPPRLPPSTVPQALHHPSVVFLCSLLLHPFLSPLSLPPIHQLHLFSPPCCFSHPPPSSHTPPSSAHDGMAPWCALVPAKPPPRPPGLPRHGSAIHFHSLVPSSLVAGEVTGEAGGERNEWMVGRGARA
ncbi:unnamed protein product [Closterium sp. Naga37s-1]|nr:unnamed protein product [Closterium sp. Naga37s-1]